MIRNHNLAFFKFDGSPWTEEELLNILKYTGFDPDDFLALHPDAKKRMYVFDCGLGQYYMWTKQEKHPNFPNCTRVSYEKMFPVKKPSFWKRFFSMVGWKISKC